MVYGLQYPWPPAADHAAEAVGALQLQALVPELVNLLNEPNPSFPVKSEKDYFVRELVRINHLCNCVLCHAPSNSKDNNLVRGRAPSNLKDDLVRGRVPEPGETPPPLYYAERTGTFVRADITYLRQDFSVVQPVPYPGKWPAQQRYDYILRVRQVTKPEMKVFQQLAKEKKLPKTYQQREAVLAALRQVTKADLGSDHDA